MVIAVMKNRRLLDFGIGAVSAALGLGLSELVAGVLGGVPSLIESLGGFVIDNVPPAVKDWAISTFGIYDKLVLVISIALVALLFGGLIGVLARGRFWIAMTGFIGFGLVASLAGSTQGNVSLGVAIVPAGVAALAGLFAMDRLYGSGSKDEVPSDPARRSVLIGLAAVGAVAGLSAGLGRVLLEQAKRRLAGRAEVVLPDPTQIAPPVPGGAELGLPGLSPVVTPNEDFYRIDTALTVPRVDLENWALTVTGMVDRPYSIGYDQLLEMPMVERYVTLSCVSNRVGGDLVGNAKWLGVPLVEILNRAGIKPEAEQVVGRSVDGDDFTVGFPVEAVFDGREALVAVGMNGEPLPFEHGFPARLVVAGLYGYVSATKWLAEIELTGWDEFDAYWIPRGWSKEAPIKTQSRIDPPRVPDRLAPGRNVIAGVAWAPERGISKVEVQVGDDGPWLSADLSEPLSADTWVQWKLETDLAPGLTRLRVRATDGDGELQDERQRPPAPNGATGYHALSAFVSEEA